MGLRTLVAQYFGVQEVKDAIAHYPMPANSVVDFKELPPVYRWYHY